MNKQEKIIVAILVIALMGTMYVVREDGQKRAEFLRVQQEQVVAAQHAAAEVAKAAEELSPVDSPSDDETEATLSALPIESDDAVAVLPEQTFVIRNDVAVLTLTTKGGGIKSVKLPAYDKTPDPAEGPVELDFSHSPTLALAGLPGFGFKNDFSVVVDDAARSAVLTATNSAGLALERKIKFVNGYELAVLDTIHNRSGETVNLSEHTIGLGPMRVLAANGADTDLAIDTKVGEKGKTPVIEIVKGTKAFGFAALFDAAGGGCKATLVSPAAPEAASFVKQGDIYWASVRERFFIQVLTPAAGPASGLEIRTVRDVNAQGERW